jgi:molybdate transport system substrate-binding protein
VLRRLLAAGVVTLLAACGSSPVDDPSSSAVSGTVDVYAAQSLTAAFTEIGDAFEDAHPDVEVALNFAGSAALVGQITQGAPADVVATADEASMSTLMSAGLVDGEPAVFARNLLQIVVRAGNPKAVDGIADLATPGTVIALCAANVPCGSYARRALDRSGITVRPASEETSVAGVLGRVRSGEADAGIVYATDVRAASDLEGVAIEDAVNSPAAYPHAVVKGTDDAVSAEAFVAFVESRAGQAILREHGFLPA